MIFFISVMIYFKRTYNSQYARKRKIKRNFLNKVQRIGITNYKNGLAIKFNTLNTMVLSNKLSPKNLKKIAFINHIMKQKLCSCMINHSAYLMMADTHRKILDKLFNGVELDLFACQMSDQRSLCNFPALYIPKCSIRSLDCKLFCCYELAHDELQDHITEILNSQCNHLYMSFLTEEDRQYVLQMLNDMNTSYTIIDDEGEVEILR